MLNMYAFSEAIMAIIKILGEYKTQDYLSERCHMISNARMMHAKSTATRQTPC